MAVEKVIEKIQSKIEVAPLKDWFLKQKEDEKIKRINVALLSKELSYPKEGLLEEFLKGVEKALFQLNWEYHCPECGVRTEHAHSFQEVKGESHCPFCDISFKNVLDKNVQVTFSPHPSIYSISLEGKFFLEKPYLSGLECIQSPLYQKLFGKEALSPEESLQVANLVFLFTDLKESTALYSQHGDALSYNIVRDHFKVLFSTIEKHGGSVVKTIGDAVMATFLEPVSSIKASLEIYKSFQEREYPPVGKLKIRMGLHRGPSLLVNLNDRIDYFGNTVNIASRVEGRLDLPTLGLTESIWKEEEVQKILKNFAKKEDLWIIKKKVSLKGVKDPISLYFLKEKK